MVSLNSTELRVEKAVDNNCNTKNIAKNENESPKKMKMEPAEKVSPSLPPSIQPLWECSATLSSLRMTLFVASITT